MSRYLASSLPPAGGMPANVLRLREARCESKLRRLADPKHMDGLVDTLYSSRRDADVDALSDAVDCVLLLCTWISVTTTGCVGVDSNDRMVRWWAIDALSRCFYRRPDALRADGVPCARYLTDILVHGMRDAFVLTHGQAGLRRHSCPFRSLGSYLHMFVNDVTHDVSGLVFPTLHRENGDALRLLQRCIWDVGDTAVLRSDVLDVTRYSMYGNVCTRPTPRDRPGEAEYMGAVRLRRVPAMDKLKDMPSILVHDVLGKRLDRNDSSVEAKLCVLKHCLRSDTFKDTLAGMLHNSDCTQQCIAHVERALHRDIKRLATAQMDCGSVVDVLYGMSQRLDVLGELLHPNPPVVVYPWLCQRVAAEAVA